MPIDISKQGNSYKIGGRYYFAYPTTYYSLGNKLIIDFPEEVENNKVQIDLADLTINGSAPADINAAKAALVSVFPKANSSAGGSGFTAATVNEINTGTDDIKGITPLGLSGSALAASVSTNTTTIATKVTSLTPTAVKTANYTASTGELVKTRPTTSDVVITIPASLADKSTIEIKQIGFTYPYKTIIQLSGSDVFNDVAGSTSGNLVIANQAMTILRDGPNNIWNVINSDTPLGQLDARFNASPVNNRPPKYSDNTIKGYITGDIWQYRGQIWKSIFSDATSSTWQIQPSVASRPYDVLTTSCIFAGGTTAMKAGYTGAAIDISVVIATVATPATINILANGELDLLTLQSYISRADVNTAVTVTKLYDQTGNTNHFVSDVTKPTLCLVYDDVQKRYVLTGGEPTDINASTANARGLKMPSSISVNGNNFGMFAFGRSVASWSAAEAFIANIGDTTNGHSIAWQTFNGSQQKWTTEQGSKVPTKLMPFDCSESVFYVGCDSTKTTFGINDTTSTSSTVPTSQTYTGGWLGSTTLEASWFTLKMVGFVISNTTPTAAQQALIRQSAYTWMDIAPQRRDNIVFIGDSRMAGYFSSYWRTIPFFVREHLKLPANIYNISKSGQTTLDMTTTSLSYATSVYNSSAKNIAVVMTGVNDFLVNSATAATTMGYITTLVNGLKAVGYKVILIAELDSVGQHTFLTQLRPLILASTIADKLVDVSGFTPIVTPSNSTYYADGLHPTSNVLSLIGSRAVEEIEAFLR